MGPKKGNSSRKQPPTTSGRGGVVNEISNDSDGENGDSWGQQTEQEKRQTRRTLREIYEKLAQNREKYAAGVEHDEIGEIIKEANEVLGQVRGTQEAMEDAKMFKLLCQTVREMSEDTNTNEKKFHSDEFAKLIGNRYFARGDGGHVFVTRRQMVALGSTLSRKFRRVPCFTFVSETINTEAPDRPKDKEKKTKRTVVDREKIATKTSIVEKNQVTEQKTDRLVNSTRKILETVYKQNGKKPVNYFEFVIDPSSFGNTVENMFHVSFLVKQRVCLLTVDEEIGLPFLEPVLGGRGGGEEDAVKNQAVISISYQDWLDLKEALEVTEAAIVHEGDLGKM